MLNEVLRAVVWIKYRGLSRIDTEMPIKCGKHLLEMDRAIEWPFTIFRSAADHLSDFEAAAEN
jgi:hypothetical protein